MEQFIIEAVKDYYEKYGGLITHPLANGLKDFLTSKLSQAYTLGLKDGKEEGKRCQTCGDPLSKNCKSCLEDWSS